MKLSDIIVEMEPEVDSIDTDYTDSMQTDLYDLLVAAKANGITTIDTNKFRMQMQSMGYELEESALLSLLQDHPMVQDANNTEITLTGGLPDVDGADGEDAKLKNRDIVRSLAQKAVSRDIK